jgi:hypothetical protein
MNIHSVNKNTNTEITASTDEKTEDLFDTKPSTSQNDERSNLDNALDDDNENPVSQTLIDAAENIGTEEKNAEQELDGEAQEESEK